MKTLKEKRDVDWKTVIVLIEACERNYCTAEQVEALCGFTSAPLPWLLQVDPKYIDHAAFKQAIGWMVFDQLVKLVENYDEPWAQKIERLTKLGVQVTGFESAPQLISTVGLMGQVTVSLLMEFPEFIGGKNPALALREYLIKENFKPIDHVMLADWILHYWDYLYRFRYISQKNLEIVALGSVTENSVFAPVRFSCVPGFAEPTLYLEPKEAVIDEDSKLASFTTA